MSVAWLRHTPRLVIAAGSYVHVLLSCLMIVLSGTNADAGDLDTRRTAKCDVHFSGEVEEGDAAKLTVALTAVDTSTAPAKRPQLETEIGYWGGTNIPRLCLDSPGGSFSEAVKFLKETVHKLSYATVIEPLAECNSACALIFLGGHLNSGDGYFEHYRRLDVSGQLGFHAPYVDPGATEVVDPAVIGKSYRKGVEAVADLLDLDPSLFPRSLLAEFLRAGADEFFNISKVGQLAAWNIGLTGYRRPNVMTEKQIEYVCNNQRIRDDPQLYSVHMSFEPEPEQASDPIPLGEKMVVRSEGIIEGVAGCTVNARLHGDVLFLRANTTEVDAGNAEPRNDAEGDVITSSAVAEDITAVDPDGYTPAYFLFNPHTKIKALKDRGEASRPATERLPATPTGTTSLQAMLWDHNGSTMRLEADSTMLRMNYEKPRKGMLSVGVREGDNLFTCSRAGSRLSCSSRIFHPRCGKQDFPAEATFSGNDKVIRLRGEAPDLDSDCREQGRKPQDWVFTLIEPAK